MIISRTPLRITLGGGGTDDPRFVREFGGGYSITAAIQQYVYVAINSMFDDGYLLRYSHNERVVDIDEIKHPIIKAAFEHFGTESGTELVSVADLPANTGLGSSAAFTVGLCRHAMSGRYWLNETKHALAETAAHIELDLGGMSGGKQDHYATAFGGVQELVFCPNGTVEAKSLQISPALQDSLVLYFTGMTRPANAILENQTLDGLAEIYTRGQQIAKYLQDEDIYSLGEAMNEHWRLKQQRSRDMSNAAISYYYDHALAHGAIGGKLVGAGGGGFLLFVTDNREALRTAMTFHGLEEVPVKFDFQGSVIL